MNASLPFDDPTGAAPANIRLGLLGPPTIALNHLILHIPRRSVRALLYRLACESAPVSRAHLYLLFWPELPEQTARRNLSHHLTHLRLALPGLRISADSDHWVCLDSAQVWCDVLQLRDGWNHISPDLARLQGIARLYRGPFLEGFDLPAHPDFERWCSLERARLEGQFLLLLEQLVENLWTCRETTLAVQYAQRYLGIDPLSEAMHRRLMQMYAAIGERHLALQQYDRCCGILKSELGISPMPETTETYLEVLNQSF